MRSLARLRDEFGLTQSNLCRVTGKPKSEISKLLALHDKVDPAIQHIARTDPASRLTKRHLYNISKLKPDEQHNLATRIQQEQLNAIETEQLVEQQSPVRRSTKLKTTQSGLAARQRRFTTSTADVLMTFRRRAPTRDEVRAALNEIILRL